MIRLINIALAQNESVPNTPSETTDAVGIIPNCALEKGGAETLQCGLELFTNIADILLGIVGAVFLAVLVYGGVLWLTSRGDSAKVSKSTKMLWSSALGLLIVFGAFSAVSYGVEVLRGQPGTIALEGGYVACVTTEPIRNAEGDVIGAGTPINEGQACAPGFECKSGTCCDTEVLSKDGTCETAADKGENLSSSNLDEIVVEEDYVELEDVQDEYPLLEIFN